MRDCVFLRLLDRCRCIRSEWACKGDDEKALLTFEVGSRLSCDNFPSLSESVLRRGFSHIFLDEAQDFSGDFLQSFKNIARGYNSYNDVDSDYCMLVCMDPFNQCAIRKDDKYLNQYFKDEEQPIILTDVFRQSRQLDIVAQRYMNVQRLERLSNLKPFMDRAVGTRCNAAGNWNYEFKQISNTGPEVEFRAKLARRNVSGGHLIDTKRAAADVDRAWRDIQAKLLEEHDPCLKFGREIECRRVFREFEEDQKNLVNTHVLILTDNDNMAEELSKELSRLDYLVSRACEKEPLCTQCPVGQSDCAEHSDGMLEPDSCPTCLAVALDSCRHYKEHRVLVVDSVIKARGLEAPVVIVYDPPLIDSRSPQFMYTRDGTDEPENIYYMAFTRAMCLMVVLTTAEGKEGFETPPHVPGKPAVECRRSFYRKRARFSSV